MRNTTVNRDSNGAVAVQNGSYGSTRKETVKEIAKRGVEAKRR